MDLINIMGFILAIISLAFAIIGFIMAFNRRVLQFNIFNSELIVNNDEKLSKLSFFYDEKPINRLTISKIVFWNGSLNNAIKRDEVPETAPLTVLLEKGEILEASILKGDKTSNLISISDVNDKKFQLSFKYLNKKDGGIIQIVHTGNEKDITVSGKLINGNIIVKQQYNGYVQNAIKTLSIVALIILTCTMTYVFLPFTDITIVQDWYIEKMKFMPPQGTAVISYCILIVLGTVLAFIFFVFGNTMRQFIPENCKE